MGWHAEHSFLLIQVHFHCCTPAHQPCSFLRDPAPSILTLLQEFSPSLCNGSFLSQSSLCLLSLTMFLSFLLLFTAYLKKQSVFTAFHLNLLCKLVSNLVPPKLLWQRHKMISMLLKTDRHVSESELCLAVVSVMLTTLTIGIPSSCGFQHTSFSADVSFLSVWLFI